MFLSLDHARILAVYGRVRELSEINKKYLNLCSEGDRRSYSFGATWGGVINDIFFILWVNYPFKGRLGDLVKKKKMCCLLKVILIANPKLSGLNLFISSVEGIGPCNVRSIIFLGPRNSIGCPTCLSACVFAYLHASCSCRHDTIYNVFLPVNETWDNLKVLHSTLHQPSVVMSLVSLWSTCVCLCVLEEAWLWNEYAGRVGSYAFKDSLLLLNSPELYTLPIIQISYYWNGKSI